ncbi:PREDICTED: uncharacterized protein LOC109239985 [Nicotiana attenuata]|uniref:uncharacterized protein LOC109239985 n=1 Tax=Nicotiana attenuata TaxID=49451 RepID=UPI0009057DE8|nr:PREDICTED: uncharacterized protein LOC109239985 [Nicotiana attenuata]
MGSLNPEPSSAPVYTYEPSSPLFLLSSNVPGVSLVAVPFSGNEFGGWKRSMIVSLSTRNKIDFIDGTCVKPPENSPQFRYGTVNGTKVFEVKRELTSTYQGSLDIPSYFNKLKKICDELGVIHSSHANSCNCATKEGLQKEREEDKVNQFLMGLNEMKNRGKSENPQFHPESASFNANSNSIKFTQPQPRQRQYNQRISFDQSKSGLFCKNCKKLGHLIDKCYKLNGFPQSFKFTKSRKTAANVVESDFSSPQNVFTNSVSNPTQNQVDQGSVVHGLSQQQYAQLISLLQQTHTTYSGPPLNTLSSASFAGTLLPKNVVYSFSSSLLSKSDSSTWIVDSGASDHMTSNKEYLINITPLPIHFLVSLPNGYKVKVTCTGSFALTKSIILHNVLYLPSFKHNVISVHKITEPFDCMVQFTRISCIIQGPSLKKPLDLGKLDNDLYKFVWEQSSQLQQPLTNVSNSSNFSSLCNSSSFSSSSVHKDSAICNKVAMNKMDVVWHNRLAHVPFVRMKSISEISSTISSNQSFPCTICPMARQTRLPFPESSIHTSKPFQLIHVDTWGPYHTPNYSGSRYFLTIVDDFFRSTWTHLMGSKSNAFSLLNAFVAMGYKLYNLHTKQCFISRDVVFHEHHFPFSSNFSFPVSSECFLPNASQPSPSVTNIDSSPETPDVTPQPQSPPISPNFTLVTSPVHSVHSPDPILHDHVPEVPPSPTSINPDIIPTTIPISSPAVTSSSSPPLRKFSRVPSHPSYLKDYVYNLPSSLSCSVTQHKEFEPYTYSQAAPIPAWQDAMRK